VEEEEIEIVADIVIAPTKEDIVELLRKVKEIFKDH